MKAFTATEIFTLVGIEAPRFLGAYRSVAPRSNAFDAQFQLPK